MRKAIPAICSTEPLTVLKRVVNVKSPKVSPSKINSGKCSSVVSRDNCASTCRRTVTDGFTFVSVACAGASSSMIFHSPGRPSPETVLRKPGGGSLSFAPLKSKYRSAAATGQAGKTKATQKANLEKAVGTAKYANHPKAERIGREERFSQWVNVLVHSTPFPFAYLACFAVGIGRLRMNRDIVPQGNKKEPADKCLRPARQSR